MACLLVLSDALASRAPTSRLRAPASRLRAPTSRLRAPTTGALRATSRAPRRATRHLEMRDTSSVTWFAAGDRVRVVESVVSRAVRK